MHDLFNALNTFILSFDIPSLLSGVGLGGAAAWAYGLLDQTGTIQAIRQARDPESPGGETITREEAVSIILRPEFLRGLLTLLKK